MSVSSTFAASIPAERLERAAVASAEGAGSTSPKTRNLSLLLLSVAAAFAGVGAASAGPWPFGMGPEKLDGPSLYEARCGGCHALDHNKYGPSHAGVFGRQAGTQPDYRYTASLAKSGIVWSEDSLDRWLTNPRKMVPGTRMATKLGDAAERHLIIEYLKSNPQPKGRRSGQGPLVSLSTAGPL